MPIEASRQELDRILDGVVDSILQAPEDEIDADLRAAGDDPEAAAERLRTRLAETVEQHRFHRRARAKMRLQQNVLLMNVRPWELPETEKQRLRLLGAAIRRRPELEGLLHAKLGDLQSLSDEEVKGYLRELAKVGALDGIMEHEE